MLACTSRHPRRVSLCRAAVVIPDQFMLWPLARFSCYNARCSDNSLTILAKLHTLIKIAKSQPKHIAIPELIAHLFDRRCIFQARSRQNNNSWLVLPFHPSLVSLPGVVKESCAMWEQSQFSHLKPSVSWRIEHMSLANFASRDADRKCKAYRAG